MLRKETRTWLRDVVTMLLAYQDVQSGAIRENPFGFHGTQCGHPPPASNAEYGTFESTLSQTKENPVADLMYSLNFALLGLHEAQAIGTNEKEEKEENEDTQMYATAANAMADFVVRTQVKGPPTGPSTTTQPPLPGTPGSLSGAWLRAVDFERWEYFASASDNGWGPWNAEVGHGGNLSSIVLEMRNRNVSMWEILTSDENIASLGQTVNELSESYFK